MTSLDVDGLLFTFPAGWAVGKYDEWAFYRKQFCKVLPGIKSLDLIAVDPEKTAWLIKVKDYRNNTRSKSIGTGDEVAQKVVDTLAAIVPAAIHANDTNEQVLARSVSGAQRLRVVLHLEQPKVASRLFPRPFDPANVALKLKTLLKPIDPRPLVTETAEMRGVAWKVT